MIIVVGRLETGKLSSGGLCVVDDVGNRIVVERSLDAAAVPHELVGKRIVASGTPSYDGRGRLRAVVAATIEQASVPALW